MYNTQYIYLQYNTIYNRFIFYFLRFVHEDSRVVAVDKTYASVASPSIYVTALSSNHCVRVYSLFNKRMDWMSN